MLKLTDKELWTLFRGSVNDLNKDIAYHMVTPSIKGVQPVCKQLYRLNEILCELRFRLIEKEDREFNEFE